MPLSFARPLRKGAVPARSVKFACWLGHSQGRDAGAAWFADTHWADLDGRAVAYLNEDVLGSRDATQYTLVASAELEQMALSGITPLLPRWRRIQQRPGRCARPVLFGDRAADALAGPWQGRRTVRLVARRPRHARQSLPPAVAEEHRAISRLLVGLAGAAVLPGSVHPAGRSDPGTLDGAAGGRGRPLLARRRVSALHAPFARTPWRPMPARAGRFRPEDRQLLAVSRALIRSFIRRGTASSPTRRSRSRLAAVARPGDHAHIDDSRRNGICQGVAQSRPGTAGRYARPRPHRPSGDWTRQLSFG